MLRSNTYKNILMSFEMSGTVVQHEANHDNLACLLWLKTQTTAEAMPPLFCHTNASLHRCTCRTVGKVVSPLWPSCWTLYRCHEPGSNHISTRQEGVHPEDARFLQRQQTGQFLKVLASCTDPGHFCFLTLFFLSSFCFLVPFGVTM